MNGTNGRRRRQALAIATALACLAGLVFVLPRGSAGTETVGDTWRGLTVTPEHRCTPYVRRDYPYPQSVEADIVASMGGWIYGPYTGRYFASTRQTDIEHIVAVSEAHDSSLCAADRTVRRRFARDPLNLTLAAPAVNRCGASGKCHYDAGEWLPPMNRCWFAHRVVSVKRKYGLAQEADLAARAQKPLHAVGRRGDDVEQIGICRPQPGHIGIERAAVRPGGVRIAMVGQHRAGIGAGVQKLAAGLGIVCRKVA